MAKEDIHNLENMEAKNVKDKDIFKELKNKNPERKEGWKEET